MLGKSHIHNLVHKLPSLTADSATCADTGEATQESSVEGPRNKAKEARIRCLQMITHAYQQVASACRVIPTRKV